MHNEEITLASQSIRLTIPPDQVRDLQRVFTLESMGFLKAGGIKYRRAEDAFVLEAEGAAVSHLLELLELATYDRSAETWAEREARQRDQLPLDLEPHGGLQALL